MRYVMARYRTDIRDMTYRFYMSDCLNLVNQRKYMTVRFADMVYKKPEPQKSGDEIAREVISKAGLVVK